MLACGCGGGGPPTVYGVVSVKGVKLNQGIVTMHGQAASRSAVIRPDGTYVLESPPEGPVVATVENEAIASIPKAPSWYRTPAKIPVPVAPSAEPALTQGRPVAIDPRYKDKNNGLREVVQGGRQELNLHFQ
jgi:hypothetical protein